MDASYWVVFTTIGAVVACQVWNQSKTGGVVTETGTIVQNFKKLRNNYVLVSALMMAGDWFQGPYVYALYEHYGFNVKDIGRLFIAGFGSSMIFGTIVGSLADKYGRKKAALLYVLTYVLSCTTKHSSNYWLLMVGRLLGGIATSLLFSVFEAWLVAEHFSEGFLEKWIGDTFAKAVFVGNGLVAILAGLLANYLVEDMKLGPVVPFDAAIITLICGGFVILFTWKENYGDKKHQSTLMEQFRAATAAIASDPRVALLGAMQSLFEAGMYTFVFLWTPALSAQGEKIPHGTIFACFMTACMAGSSSVTSIMRRARPELYMQYVFGIAACALLVPALCHVTMAPGSPSTPPSGLSFVGHLQFLAFLVFEVMVGIFWPSMMTMRALYIPEELRSTIMNFFRVPLNLFVCIVLYNVSLFPLYSMFLLCTCFMGIAAYCQMRLYKLVVTPHSSPTGSSGDREALLGAHDKSQTI